MMSIKKYLVAAETSFKERYNNYTRDFKHKKYMKCSVPNFQNIFGV